MKGCGTGLPMRDWRAAEFVYLDLAAAQRHAFGIIGGVAFGLERRTLTRLAKELRTMGLVATDGAHAGQNRSTYHWKLTERGQAVLVDMVQHGLYPLARHTDAGRAALEASR